MEAMNERDALICRSEIQSIAQEFNLLVTISTIHRWANEPDFPVVRGQNGRNLVYSSREVIAFLKKRVKKLQEDR